MSVEISILIPLYNEEPNVAPLHAELSTILTSMGLSYEMLAVDDGRRTGRSRHCAASGRMIRPFG